MIKQLSTKTVYENQWMRVREDEVEFGHGHRGIYGVVEQDDFVLVVPFDGEQFHLVRQYRYPIEKYSLEFPQGKHEGESKEDQLKVARAELEEEIGLQAGKMERIGFFYEALGYCNQGFDIFVASEFSAGTVNPDEYESEMERVSMGVAEFEQAVAGGEIFDAPTVSAYGLLKVKGLI